MFTVITKLILQLSLHLKLAIVQTQLAYPLIDTDTDTVLQLIAICSF